MASTNKSGLSLGLKSRDKVVRNQKGLENVFGDSSDDADEAPTDRAERFAQKFGTLKARDDRAVQKVLEEDSSIYDYDAHYEEREKRKAEYKEAAKLAEKDAKPKYADKLMKAKERRDLEKLIIEESKQNRERAEEGGKFADKDVFVTGAYRKQIEEKEKFRKELEIEEKVNQLNEVSKSSMWSETFAKKRLDELTKEREERIRGPALPPKEEQFESTAAVKQEDDSPTTSKKAEKETEGKGKRRFPPFSSSSSEAEEETVASTDTLKPGLNRKKTSTKDCEKRKRSRSRSHERHRPHSRGDRYKYEKGYDKRRTEKSRNDKHRSYRDDYGKDKHRERHGDQHRHRSPRRFSPPRHGRPQHSHVRDVSPVRNTSRTTSSHRDSSPRPSRKFDRKEPTEKVDKRSTSAARSPEDMTFDEELKYLEAKYGRELSSREKGALEVRKRMQKVQRILRHHNDDDQIDLYAKRYFERREAGMIIPPIAGQDD